MNYEDARRMNSEMRDRPQMAPGMPDSRSPLELSIERLNGRIDGLDSVATRLEQRLSMITRVPGPTAAASPSSEAHGASAACIMLNAAANRMQEVYERLDLLIDRLEV